MSTSVQVSRGRLRRMLQRTRLAVTGASVLVVLAGSVFTVGAASSFVALTPRDAAADATWSSSSAPLSGLSPAAATTQESVHLYSVACATPTSCVAVGSYAYGVGSGSNTQGLIETGTLTGGTWQWKAVTAPASGLTPPLLTFTSAAQGSIGLYGVSCGTATSCVAVGGYVDGASAVDGGIGGLVETGTESDGSWTWVPSSVPTSTLSPTLYTGAGTNAGSVYLSAISCSGEVCVATGYYNIPPTGGGSQVREPLFWVNESDGWKQQRLTTAALSPPPGPMDDSPLTVSSVSCSSASACVAVGGYTSASGSRYGLVAQGNPIEGTWTSSNAVAPTSPASNYAFTGVACASLSSCVVAGTTGLYSQQDIVETGTLSASTWKWTDSPVPSKMDFNNGTTVACPSAAYCVIAGDGFATVGTKFYPQFESGVLTKGKWDWTTTDASLSGLSPGINASSIPQLQSVACKVTSCVGVGLYANTASGSSGLIETAAISGGSVVTGTIDYTYAAGAGFVRGTPFIGEAQKTPARDTEVDILAATKSSCSSDVLSSTFTSDTGVYSSAPIASSEHYFCVKVLAATPYSQVVDDTAQHAAGAANGTLSKDDADATDAMGPQELDASGDTTFSWTSKSVDTTIDQALDVDNAVVTGATWLKLYGETPKFSNILYPYPASSGVSNFNASTSVGLINPDDAFDWGVLLHEYGHLVAALLKIDNTTPVAVSQHSYESNMTDRESTKYQGLAIAWDEGFADFFSQMVQRAMGASALGLKDVGGSPPVYIDHTANASIILPLAVPGDSEPTPSLGEDNELAIARVLWALYDQPSYAGGEGSVAFMKVLSGAMTMNSERDLSHAVLALESAAKALPWVPDVGKQSTNVEIPAHFNDEAAATTFGTVLSSQRVAPTIKKVTVDASGASIKVKWVAGQPEDAKDALNFFVVQFWDRSWNTLLTEQIVATRSLPLAYEGGSLVFQTTQATAPTWKQGPVHVVVLGWNTHELPQGLSSGSTSNVSKGLDPLTGPYISAPLSLTLG